MKPITFNQEILFIAGTSFSKQELCNEASNTNVPADNSCLDQLANACWAGLICELLPELGYGLPLLHNVITWSVIASNQYLVVNHGTAPAHLDKESSVDPNLFMAVLHFN